MNQSNTNDEAKLRSWPHCFVLLPTDALMPVQALADQISQDHRVDADSTSKWDQEVLTFEADVGRVMLAKGSSPIPNGEASLAASGNAFWENGKDAADQHQSHLVVGLDNVGDRIDTAIGLSKVVRTVLATVDAIGVYWSRGKIANSREFFLQSSTGLSRANLPLHLWMRFQLHRKDDRWQAYTIGMGQFRHQEIYTTECTWPPNKLVGYVYDTAHHIVSNQVILKDRDTVRRSDNDRFEVRFVPNPYRPTETVTQIQLS